MYRHQHWVQLQRCDGDKEHIHQVCRELEAATMHFFVSFGYGQIMLELGFQF
jgi:hypothetical protein